MRNWKLLMIAGMVMVSGCTHIGTRSVQRDMPGFNEAVAQATDEQLLSNLVRLRFRASPSFLSVVNIAASEHLSMGASAGFNIIKASPANTRTTQRNTGAQLGYSQQPTISYRPLHGIEFSRHLTRPIPLETMLMLGISGFDFLDIWELFIESLTPEETSFIRLLNEAPFPDEIDTRRFAVLMMQIGNVTDFDYRNPFKGRGMSTRPSSVNEETRMENARVMADVILRRFADKHEPDVLQGFRNRYLSSDDTVLIYRSMLGVLYDLSAAVAVDEGDKGVDEFVRLEARSYLRIHSGPRPNNAYCVTRYRGVWYWIDNDDMRSKTTLSLLTILFNAISDSGDGGRPQFTIPLR